MLRNVLDKTPGAMSVVLMGFDGIAIDQQTVDAPPADQDPNSWNAAAVELAHISTQLKTISEGLGTGELREVSVRTGSLTTVIRTVTEEYIIALSLAPDANVGKGRYLMRVLLPKLKAELI